MFESVGAKVRFRFRLNYLYCHSFACLTVNTPHSSSLQYNCRELATLCSSWVDTLQLQYCHPDILHAPHAPPHTPPHAPCALYCRSFGTSQLILPTHPLCSCTAESLPPSTPPGSILPFSAVAVLPPRHSSHSSHSSRSS